jgi:hypothetical protein
MHWKTYKLLADRFERAEMVMDAEAWAFFRLGR